MLGQLADGLSVRSRIAAWFNLCGWHDCWIVLKDVAPHTIDEEAARGQARRLGALELAFPTRLPGYIPSHVALFEPVACREREFERRAGSVNHDSLRRGPAHRSRRSPRHHPD
jgi:hypothetical protein